MKTLANNLENLSVLSEIEMSKVLGGTNSTYASGVEDEDAWF